MMKSLNPIKFILISFFIFVFVQSFDFHIANAGEQDTYDFSWLDPDKEVFVLQNRRYRKKGKFYFNLSGGITTSGAFIDSNPLQARAGFFFKEEWGAEALYSLNNGERNDTFSTVQNLRGIGGGSTPFIRIIENYKAALFLWSPFYAKINTFNSILYFDWVLGLGYVNLMDANNREEVLVGATSRPADSSENHHGIIWETALKFYISESFEVRLDLTTMHYEAEKNDSSQTGWYSNFDFTVGLGYSF